MKVAFLEVSWPSVVTHHPTNEDPWWNGCRVLSHGGPPLERIKRERSEAFFCKVAYCHLAATQLREQALHTYEGVTFY